MLLTDELFLKIMRGRQRGGINPGMDLGLPQNIVNRACDTADMQDNLWLMYSIAVGMRAKRILEIGCNDGTSTLPFLKAAFEVDGHVDSVDVCDVAVAEAVINKLELQSRWTFTQGNSHDVLKKFKAEGRQYDIVLIDGDHTYSGAKEDLEDCVAMLSTNGIVFTHDNWCVSISVDWNKPFGERAILGDAFLAREMLSGPDWVGVVLPFNSNLGIFQRRSDVMGAIEHNIAAAQKEGLVP